MYRHAMPGHRSEAQYMLRQLALWIGDDE